MAEKKDESQGKKDGDLAGAIEKDDPTPAEAQPDQIELNLRVYERVFGLCVEAGKRLHEKHFAELLYPGEILRDRTMEMAKAMFDRFWSDQAALASAGRQFQHMTPLINQLQNVQEGRFY